ncbi:MAG: glycoside hydrolase family 97 C-terminal domain-containing protein, partial [Chitinophagaceae bacterium]
EKFQIELPFLIKGEYSMSLITDGTTGNSFAHQKKGFNAGQSIRLTMLKKGGFVAFLKQK